MQSGLPVISTNVGAIPELITDGVEGFLIEPGDVEALADRMVRVGADATLRERMGHAGRDLVRKRYSMDAMAETLEALYWQILGRRPCAVVADAGEQSMQRP